MSSLRINLAAGMMNGLGSAVLALAAVPLYLHLLGIEGYGLISFYLALTGVLQLLDLGLTPTMSREVAIARASGSLTHVRTLLHTFATLSWGIGLLLGFAVALASPAIGTRWLQASAIPPAIVQQAVMLIGVTIAARWPLAVYNSVLIGAERLVLASVINMISQATATVGAILILSFVSPTVSAFFVWNAAVGLATVLATRQFAWSSLVDASSPRFDLDSLVRIWKFSVGAAVTGVLGAVFVQSDKLVLSRFVPLAALGEYSLAWMVTRTLYLVVSPTFNVIYPRLAYFSSQAAESELLQFYKTGTRLLMVAVWSGTLFLSFLGGDLITAWTGHAGLGHRVAPLVILLAIGTALNTAMIFPYALQLASGATRIPAIITTTLLIVFVPMLVIAVHVAGTTGAAASWLVLNALYVPFGAFLTHRTLLRGQGARWMLNDVMLPAAVAMIAVGLGAFGASRTSFGALTRVAIGMAVPTALAALAIAFRRPLARLLKLIPDAAEPQGFSTSLGLGMKD